MIVSQVGSQSPPDSKRGSLITRLPPYAEKTRTLPSAGLDLAGEPTPRLGAESQHWPSADLLGIADRDHLPAVADLDAVAPLAT